MLVSIICAVSLFCSVRADVAHFFAPEFGGFLQHHLPPHIIHQHPQPQEQFTFAHIPVSDGLSDHYGPPAHVNPSASTPAPVAPTAPATEFGLPEIVENRSAKSRSQFIPLSPQYLPPNERPNYESPKPPEIAFDEQGYYYPQPRPSTTTSTTTAPSPIIVQDPFESERPLSNPAPPGYDYNAPPTPLRPSTPAPVYLPPSQPIAAGDDVPDSTTPPLRLRVHEMRCLQHADGYFRAVLKVNSFISVPPIVDNDSFDKHCELQLRRSFVVADIAAVDFKQCGVTQCGKDLCLRLRFPQISGMRTSADPILTLHCKSQERVAVKTHALKMGVANDAQARGAGSFAHGGTQNPFRTHVELLRRTNNGFTRHLDANSAVQLGEELLLRAHVLAGDGWNYTKLTDVSMQRISASGELVNAASLINSRGCLNPTMQSICAHAPTPDPPLGSKVHFRAIMFQGMRSGEELVLTMRITACLDPQDCHVNAGDCSGGSARRRRETNSRASNGSEVSEISRVSFRVVMPGGGAEAVPTITADDYVRTREESTTSPRALVLLGSVGFVALFVGLGIFATVKLKA